MRHLSLFTGSGIGDYAAKQAGIETVAQCENNPACQYALQKLWPECHLFKDVKDVSAEGIRRIGLGPIDIISGGFPCVDISTAGKGKGLGTPEAKTRSGLWYEMARVIGEVRPRWILAENVAALYVRGADRVLADLEALDYQCWPVVVGSWSVGAPHKRDRVWIVGRLADAGCLGISGRRIAGDLAEAAGATEADGQQRERLRDSAGDGGATVADTEYQGLRRWQQSEPRGPEEALSTTSIRREGRFPARPGEPQHAWEAPRLAQFGVGAESAELAGRILASLGSGGNGIPPHKAASQANKSLLRMIGNGWQFELPLMIYQWIVEQEAIRAYK